MLIPLCCVRRLSRSVCSHRSLADDSLFDECTITRPHRPLDRRDTLEMYTDICLIEATRQTRSCL